MAVRIYIDSYIISVILIPSPLSSALSMKTAYLSNEKRVRVQKIKENAPKIASSL